MSDFRKKCPSCDGDGELTTSHRFTCYSCDGTGWITNETNYNEIVESERKMWNDYNVRLNASEYRQMGG